MFVSLFIIMYHGICINICSVITRIYSFNIISSVDFQDHFISIFVSICATMLASIFILVSISIFEPITITQIFTKPYQSLHSLIFLKFLNLPSFLLSNFVSSHKGRAVFEYASRDKDKNNRKYWSGNTLLSIGNFFMYILCNCILLLQMLCVRHNIRLTIVSPARYKALSIVLKS